MELFLSNINPDEASLQELQDEIARLNAIREEHFNLEQSIKIFINSCYGACASKFFECNNVDSAEATTLQGQDLIFFANKIIIDYIRDMWHLDYELHKKMGATNVRQILEPDRCLVYNDTDSTYITFAPLYDTCTYNGDITHFILDINTHRMEGYLKQKFDEYAHERNTANLQELELEKISHSAIMFKKKKYVLNLSWKDPGAFYGHLEKVKATGIELAQGGTSRFARRVFNEFIKVILDKVDKLTYPEILAMVKRYKQEFIQQNPEDISITKSVGDYNKYILEDRNRIVLGPKCQANLKACAVYNHTLLNSKYLDKYSLIQTGDKCKYYYTKGRYEVFGYLPNQYPIEFAPQIDYDTQFEKVILDPINRYIEALNFKAISGGMHQPVPVFRL